jgi:hypothetical protein
MVNNYGFKMKTNNVDWDINIDGLIKQVQNQAKTIPKKKKK